MYDHLGPLQCIEEDSYTHQIHDYNSYNNYYHQFLKINSVLIHHMIFLEYTSNADNRNLVGLKAAHYNTLLANKKELE